jgi:hypothetical protein
MLKFNFKDKFNVKENINFPGKYTNLWVKFEVWGYVVLLRFKIKFSFLRLMLFFKLKL